MSESTNVILVPGNWLGGWAWDEVVEPLRARGLAPTSVTLPGLESADASRSDVSLADHVTAVRAAFPTDGSVVLVAHSGGGAVVTGALDAAPDRVARVVYVDSGPSADGSVANPELPPEADELPLPSFEELTAAGASLDGLDEDALALFRERAVPHPAGPLREPLDLQNPARNDIPATMVCCSFPSAVVQQQAAAGVEMFAPLTELSDLSYVDLPTGHWPMWSRPADLAGVIAAAVGGNDLRN
jgi:pimeloyl-ACP methyl ester carboxylesterase